jgi:hypothetical protein
MYMERQLFRENIDGFRVSDRLPAKHPARVEMQLQARATESRQVDGRLSRHPDRDSTSGPKPFKKSVRHSSVGQLFWPSRPVSSPSILALQESPRLSNFRNRPRIFRSIQTCRHQVLGQISIQEIGNVDARVVFDGSDFLDGATIAPTRGHQSRKDPYEKEQRMNGAIPKKLCTRIEPKPKAAPCDESPGMGTDAPMQFMVLCQKRNGRRLLFRRFATQDEADAAAAALRRVGCAATVSSTSNFTLTEEEQ